MVDCVNLPCSKIVPRYAVYNSSQLQLVHINCQKMTVPYRGSAQIGLLG